MAYGRENNFTKSKCRISGKIGFYTMPLENSYNVDSKNDLRLIAACKANPSSMKMPNTFREPESPYNAKYP